MITANPLKPMTSGHLVRTGPRQWTECSCNASYSHLAGQEQQ